MERSISFATSCFTLMAVHSLFSHEYPSDADIQCVRTHDENWIQTATGLARYEVDPVWIVAPSDTGFLAPMTGSPLRL